MDKRVGISILLLNLPVCGVCAALGIIPYMNGSLVLVGLVLAIFGEENNA